MFGQYFGNYLVEKNKISQLQLDTVMSQHENMKVKLGLIAVAEKLLTTKQAEEVNNLQKQMDRRFGDIAVEKGYLLKEEVNYLLNLQGNPYLKFVQALTDNNYLTLEEIEESLQGFKNEYNFSDSDLEALKTGDIDNIIPVFVDVNQPLSGEYISLAIRNVVRFIDNNIVLKKSYTVKNYPFECLACQNMVGDHKIFTGFASKDDSLLTIASSYAKEEFTEMNEDAYDSVCEFANIINGLYASKLSHEDIHIDMAPPLFYNGKNLVSDGDIFVVPILINGKQSDLIISVNSNIEIN